jgi:hypothetical protein
MASSTIYTSIDTIITNIRTFIKDYKINPRDNQKLIKEGSSIIEQIVNLNSSESQTKVQDLVSNIFPSRIITPTQATTSSDESLTNTSEQYADFMSSIITSVNSSSNTEFSLIRIIPSSIDESAITDFSFSLVESTSTPATTNKTITVKSALTDNIKTTVDILFKLVILSAMNNSEIKAKLVAINNGITLQQGRFITTGKIYCIEGVLIPPNFSDIDAMFVNNKNKNNLPVFTTPTDYTLIKNIDKLNDSLTIDNINEIYDNNIGALNFCEGVIQPASLPIPALLQPASTPASTPAPSTGSILTETIDNDIYRNYLIKLYERLTALDTKLTEESKQSEFNKTYSVLNSLIKLSDFEQKLATNLHASIIACLHTYHTQYNQLIKQINVRINNLPSTIEKWNASNAPQPFLYYKYKETTDSETKSFFKNDTEYNKFNACLLQIIANYTKVFKNTGPTNNLPIKFGGANHTKKNKNTKHLNKTLKNYYD